MQERNFIFSNETIHQEKDIQRYKRFLVLSETKNENYTEIEVKIKEDILKEIRKASKIRIYSYKLNQIIEPTDFIFLKDTIRFIMNRSETTVGTEILVDFQTIDIFPFMINRGNLLGFFQGSEKKKEILKGGYSIDLSSKDKLEAFISHAFSLDISFLSVIQREQLFSAFLGIQYYFIAGLARSGKSTLLVILSALYAELDNSVLVLSRSHNSLNSFADKLKKFKVPFSYYSEDKKAISQYEETFNTETGSDCSYYENKFGQPIILAHFDSVNTANFGGKNYDLVIYDDFIEQDDADLFKCFNMAKLKVIIASLPIIPIYQNNNSLFRKLSVTNGIMNESYCRNKEIDFLLKEVWRMPICDARKEAYKVTFVNYEDWGDTLNDINPKEMSIVMKLATKHNGLIVTCTEGQKEEIEKRGGRVVNWDAVSGIEEDCIIVSLVDCKVRKENEAFKIMDRIVSRTNWKLIIVGHLNTIKTQYSLKRMMRYIQKRGIIVDESEIDKILV